MRFELETEEQCHRRWKQESNIWHRKFALFPRMVRFNESTPTAGFTQREVLVWLEYFEYHRLFKDGMNKPFTERRLCETKRERVKKALING